MSRRSWRIVRTLACASVMCTLMSCRSADWTGTNPGTYEDLKRVPLSELARYLEKGSGGLVYPSPKATSHPESLLTFTWDPYDRRRILAPFYVDPESAQALFFFDEVRFVREAGERDFLTASYRYYRQRPFNERKQAHMLPYRTLKNWGSLFYPPIKLLTQPLAFYDMECARPPAPDSVPSTFFDPEFQVRLDEISGTSLTYGNTLRPLFNGVQSYPEKLRLASEAQRILYVAVMAIVADATGQELIRIMVNRKRAGVDVRLITEDLYAYLITDYAVGVLEREGIPVARVADKRADYIGTMFHDKFWIRDGEEAILGGMNVLDYENEGSGFNFLNRDTDVLVEGPAVTDLLEDFIRLWNRYDKEGRPIQRGDSILAQRLSSERAEGVRGREQYARWLGDPHTRMNGICRVAVQGTHAEPENIVTLLIRYLEAARNSFIMTSPEIDFDPGRRPPESIDILGLLMMQKARDPSFTVRYITNGRDGGMGESSAFLRSRVKDSKLVGETLWEDILTPIADQDGREVHRGVRRKMMPFLEAGVRGFQYFNYMHAKEFFFDRLLVGIGSWNFDSYSADNNHECMIFCLDESLRAQMEAHLVLDMVNSVPMIPATVEP